MNCSNVLGIIVVSTIMGLTMSFPTVLQDQLNPVSDDVGDALLRVKKASKADEDSSPINSPPLDEDKKKLNEKRTPVVLDLKESSRTTGNFKKSDAGSSDSSSTTQQQPKAEASGGEVLPPKENKLNENERAATADDDEMGAKERLPPIEELLRRQNMEEKNKRKILREFAPSAMEKSSAEPDYEVKPEEPIAEVESMMRPKNILIVGGPRRIADGAQAMPPFLRMFGQFQGPPVVPNGYLRPMSNMNVGPFRDINVPSDMVMLRRILQQQSEIKDMLGHILDQQNIFQDSLYRIESRVGN